MPSSFRRYSRYLETPDFELLDIVLSPVFAPASFEFDSLGTPPAYSSSDTLPPPAPPTAVALPSPVTHSPIAIGSDTSPYRPSEQPPERLYDASVSSISPSSSTSSSSSSSPLDYSTVLSPPHAFRVGRMRGRHTGAARRDSLEHAQQIMRRPRQDHLTLQDPWPPESSSSNTPRYSSSSSSRLGSTDYGESYRRRWMAAHEASSSSSSSSSSSTLPLRRRRTTPFRPRAPPPYPSHHCIGENAVDLSAYRNLSNNAAHRQDVLNFSIIMEDGGQFRYGCSMRGKRTLAPRDHFSSLLKEHLYHIVLFTASRTFFETMILSTGKNTIVD